MKTRRSRSSRNRTRAKTYTFGVRQTYSDGSVVDWSGSRVLRQPCADDRGPKSSLGGGGSSTLALIALVVGAVGVLLGALALVLGRQALARVRRVAPDRRGRGSARAARDRVRARGAAPHGPAGERHREHAAEPGRAHLQRGGRAALRDRLGHGRRRQPGDDGAAAAFAGGPRHAARAAARRSQRAGTSSTGGRSRSTGTRCAERSPSPSARTPGRRRSSSIPSISETAATPRLLTARWLVFLSMMVAIGLAVLRLAIARPVVRRVGGTSLRSVTVAFAVSCRGRARRDPDLPPRGDGGLRAALGVRGRRARPTGPRLGVRARLPRPRARASRSSSPRRARDSGSTGPNGERRSLAELLAGTGAALAARRRAAHPGRVRARRADRAARRRRCVFDWLAPRRRLDLDRRSRRPARALAQPAGRRRASQGSPSRAALLERRVRLGRCADRLGNAARRSSTCRRSRRCGRRRTARRSS